MFIKTLLAKLIAKLTGRKCCRCAHNGGGVCYHPNTRMYMKCWHSVTLPGFEEIGTTGETANSAAANSEEHQEGQPCPLTNEEEYQLQKIREVLQAAGDTARESGLVEG